MTRATRERLQRGAPSPAATFATVRVRFPEGISLQVREWAFQQPGWLTVLPCS